MFRKFPYLCLTIIALMLFTGCKNENSTTVDKTTTSMESTETAISEKVLRHVVLVKLKDSTQANEIALVENEFAALQDKIPSIIDFEWGINNSPEGLNKGFTHSFLVTFKDEAGREVYLPHPDHLAFIEILKKHLDDVLVIDYWTAN